MKSINKQTGSSVIAGLIALLFWVFVAVSWGTDLYKLIDCDFEPSYKAEVIHGIGLIPLVSCVTAWVDVGK